MAQRRASVVDELNETLVRRKVALMRELGIVVLGDTTLGPPPLPKVKLDKKDADPRAERRSYYESMLNRNLSDAELDALP